MRIESAYDTVSTHAVLVIADTSLVVTQMLSGYGHFWKCLQRMGKTASSYSIYKEGKVIDTVEHTVF